MNMVIGHCKSKELTNRLPWLHILIGKLFTQGIKPLKDYFVEIDDIVAH